jgi:hypothetical protein
LLPAVIDTDVNQYKLGGKEARAVNWSVIDSAGHELTLTTEPGNHAFEAVTCSPHADGFTVLNSLIGRAVPRAQLQAACDATVSRNEVCVLPAAVSPTWRILLTPTLGSLDASTRLDASRLMTDLFRASQAKEVNVGSLLVTHFAYVRKYPEPHVLGILDALKNLSTESFQNLRLLCFQMRPELALLFETSVRGAFAAQL